MAAELEKAEKDISMLYFTFDHGEDAWRIARILAERVEAGVRVRLMVDGFGQVLDAPRHSLANRKLVSWLRGSGVQVDVFHPSGNRLNPGNRLHCKICAVDDRTAFIGGSNIGDHYLDWHDHNMRMDGDLGSVFHKIYDFILSHTSAGKDIVQPALHLSRLFAAEAKVSLTVPKQRRDVRRALLDLILDAEKEIYIRNWYFLPDREILNALRSQARRGVKVYVLLSNRTRVRPIDGANYIHAHKLAKDGGRVYRFTGGYMHAKVAWNDRGQVLFGSANMDVLIALGELTTAKSVLDAVPAALKSDAQVHKSAVRLAFAETAATAPSPDELRRALRPAHRC